LEQIETKKNFHSISGTLKKFYVGPLQEFNENFFCQVAADFHVSVGLEQVETNTSLQAMTT